MTDLLYEISSWFRPYLGFISSALVATLLVIYGSLINKTVWTLIKGAHFIVRTLVFVALCLFGYGALSTYLIPLVQRAFLMVGNMWLGVVVVLVFLGVGWLAERRSRKL